MFLAITISVSKIGKTNRDIDTLSDVNKIGKITPQFSSIKVSQKTYENWALQFYLVRYFDVYINSSSKNNYTFYLKEKSETIKNSELYNLPLNTKQFDLYKTAKE
jgi:hypothetical protein